ncbi:imm68 putative immunity domain-containing protein [Lachnoanaerobaculum orale]|uniref:imm68 putative immunity domain-containing protein n=1 Tax=Lachnoanaerobaculum orale TaxID=979627 RepID=UPI0023A90EE4|nr:imm68 putative immunity domain-containing protein [Lachnoanaerobaculum orale]
MYISKYWGEFIGGSDDSLSLIEFLEGLNKEEITLKEIFIGIGLDRQNMDFRQTVENLEFTNSIGLEIYFNYAIDIVTDLAAILLECKNNGHVNIGELYGNEDEQNRCIRVVATEEEYTAIKAALEDFVKDPKSYDLYEMIGDDIIEMAEIVKELRKELLQYEL